MHSINYGYISCYECDIIVITRLRSCSQGQVLITTISHVIQIIYNAIYNAHV